MIQLITFRYVHSVCRANPVPCCLCEDTGEPGKKDPETGECMCKCFCDPPDNTIPSVKVSLQLFRDSPLLVVVVAVTGYDTPIYEI